MLITRLCIILILLSSINVIAQTNQPDSIPYYINVDNETVVQRSFMFYEGKVLTYCISIGNPEGTHFSFNSFNGALIIGWRGQFLNAHLMWVHKARGIGVAQPVGTEILFGNEKAYASGATYKSNWTDSIVNPDTLQFLGYDVDKMNRPVFRYKFNETTIEDNISIKNEKDIIRSLHLPEGANGDIYFRLISGNTIKKKSSTQYLIDNTIKITVPKRSRVSVQPNGTRQMLIVPLTADFEYTISW